MTEAKTVKVEESIETKIKEEPLGGRKTFLSLGKELLGQATKRGLMVVVPSAELREGAGLEYKVIAEVDKGEDIALLETSDKWNKVRTSTGIEGWIWGGSLAGSKFRVVLSLVNVRRAAGTAHDVITRVKKDTILTILDEVEGWYRVRLPNGSEGWIWGETLVLSAAN